VVELDHIRSQFTKSSTARFAEWCRCLRTIDAELIVGDVVEAGVWRGGNIMAARIMAPDRMCWLYDTFDGMTKPTLQDRKPNGMLALDSYRRKTATQKWARVPLDEVRGYFEAAGVLDEDRLRFVVGPVERTLLDPANVPDQIALLRLDTDWHASTKIELETLWPRVVDGGFLIVDDFFHWLGCRKAVEDYFRGRRFEPMPIDDTAIVLRK
jgi:O-methyltransferase